MPDAFLSLRRRFRSLGTPNEARHLQRFFKTGPGQYAEHDQFLGIRVPVIRQWVKIGLPWNQPQVSALLTSPWHEERMLGLLILVRRFQRADPKEAESIYTLYVDHTKFINNWDLVDVTAHHIVGMWLWARPRNQLFSWVYSPNLWERRIAMVATWAFIRQQDYSTTLALAKCLLKDSHDLLHKATGWMLREVGKRDLRVLQTFLMAHAPVMPRTMLRYALEKMPPAKRQMFMVR